MTLERIIKMPFTKNQVMADQDSADFHVTVYIPAKGLITELVPETVTRSTRVEFVEPGINISFSDENMWYVLALETEKKEKADIVSSFRLEKYLKVFNFEGLDPNVLTGHANAASELLSCLLFDNEYPSNANTNFFIPKLDNTGKLTMLYDSRDIDNDNQKLNRLIGYLKKHTDSAMQIINAIYVVNRLNDGLPKSAAEGYEAVRKLSEFSTYFPCETHEIKIPSLTNVVGGIIYNKNQTIFKIKELIEELRKEFNAHSEREEREEALR